LTATQAGNGSFAAASDVVRSFEVAAVVPGKPRISSVSSSTRALSIGFDAPASDGGSSILNYVATATPTGGGSAVTGPCADTIPPLACTIDGLANGTEYTVTVAATNAAGTGANSDASDPATPAGRANAVTGAHAIPGDGSVNLYWEPISTEGLGGGTFVRYEVYMREEGNAWPSSAAWTTGTIGSSTRSKEFTSFDDSSGNTQTVDNDKNYEFKIVVITDIITTELAGNTTLVAQSARAVPSAIRSLTVTELTSTSALVTWDEPLSDGGADITSYTIVWSDGATCGTVENRSCTATGLSAGTTYTVSGIATNYVGSSASASTTFTTASNGGGGGSSGGGSGSGGDSSSGGGSSSGGVTESDSATTAGDPDSDGVLADEPTGTPEDVSAGSSLGALLAGGERVDFVIRPNQERDGWEGIAPAFTMQADAVMPSGSPRPLAVDTSLEVPRSAFVRVRANGYQPRSRVRLFLVPAVQERTAPLLDARLASEWIFLGETTVDSAGSLIARHAVPPSARLGNYTLQVHGLSEAYGEMTVHLGMRIVDEVPDLTPGVLQRAAFYRDRTSTFSVKGRKKLNYLVNQLPSNAQAVQVMITGVSVSLDDFESNLALAGKRARKLADRLKDEGVSGDYSVNVNASFTVDAAERALRGKDTVAEREDGKPLTTVTILFQEPASAR
jgi:uncharacterized membrane protein YgcG